MEDYEEADCDQEMKPLLVDESVVSSSAVVEQPAPCSSPLADQAGMTMIKMATPSSSSKKESRRGNRYAEFIQDNRLRLKSYFRRRHVPLKKAFDMDLQCGTLTFLMQISDDIQECLYYGHDGLISAFLSPQGLSLSLVNNFIEEGK